MKIKKVEWDNFSAVSRNSLSSTFRMLWRILYKHQVEQTGLSLTLTFLSPSQVKIQKVACEAFLSTVKLLQSASFST